MLKQCKGLVFLLGVLLLPASGAAENCADMDVCMTESMRSAAEDTTIGVGLALSDIL